MQLEQKEVWRLQTAGSFMNSEMTELNNHYISQ